MADILKHTSSKLSLRRGGMSFEEIFGPGKQAGPAPVSPEARKWRRAFADNVTAVLRVRNIPRIEAEKVAFENTVIEFLNATHPDTDPNRCAHCSRPETPDSVLRPIGVGSRHTWLHSDCVALWREQRRAEAIAALAEAGVPAPVPVQQENVPRPEPDYAIVFRERLRAAGEDALKEEVRLRSFEAVVNLYRSHHPGTDIDAAKVAVLAAIKQGSTKETAQS